MADMTLEEAVSIARQAEKESQAYRRIGEAGRAIVELHESANKARSELARVQKSVVDESASLDAAVSTRNKAEAEAVGAKAAAVEAVASIVAKTEEARRDAREEQRRLAVELVQARESHQRALDQARQQYQSGSEALRLSHAALVVELDAELAAKKAQLSEVRNALKELSTRVLAGA